MADPKKKKSKYDIFMEVLTELQEELANRSDDFSADRPVQNWQDQPNVLEPMNADPRRGMGVPPAQPGGSYHPALLKRMIEKRGR